MRLFDKLRGSKRIPDSVDFLTACSLENIGDVIRILKENENVINSLDTEGNTALIYAAGTGKIDVVELLIKSDADLNIQTPNGITALMYALLIGHKDIVELLINNGADLNIQTPEGVTALIYAVDRGHQDIVELLIKGGADINILDNEGNTALIYAAREGKTEVVELLIKSGANLNIKNKEFNDNGLIYGNTTALILSAFLGYTDIVELLIKSGANLNIQNPNGFTALFFAAIDEHKDIVELLIKGGADLNILDTEGNTALMYAANDGKIDVVELLIRSGADLNIQSKNGFTALLNAAGNGHEDIVELLTKNNKTGAFIVDTKDNTTDCYYVDLEATKVVAEEARKIAEEKKEQEIEARKQKAMDIFFDFQKELRNPIYGEGTLAKIRSVMYQMSKFTTGQLDLTDADLESAQAIFEEIKTNWRKVEMECFVELESETEENGDGRKELCKITSETCENSEKDEYRKTEKRNGMKEYCEEGSESEYSKKRELIQSFATKNYEKLSKTTKNTYNALSVEMNKKEVQNAIGTVGKVINIALTEENMVKKLKEEQIIGKKTAFALKLILPIVETKLIVLKPITPIIKKSLRNKMK